MARTKSTPRRAPSFLGDAERDIPRELALSATTPEAQAQLLRVSADHELVIPTDWISQQQAAHRAERRRDLKKALRIITAWTSNQTSTEENGPITKDMCDWSFKLVLKEKELDDAEEVAKEKKAQAALEQENEVPPVDPNGKSSTPGRHLYNGTNDHRTECRRQRSLRPDGHRAWRQFQQ
jgi:hypothetical protein